MGHGAWGIGHWEEGQTGHWPNRAKRSGGMGHWALGIADWNW